MRDPKEIEISVLHDVLTIKGERKSEKEAFKNGVLEVSIPLPKKLEAKKIPLQKIPLQMEADKRVEIEKK